MISATKRWLRRNRTNFAIGVGVLGVGYVAGQYVLSKITEARERMTSDRIAKEKCVDLPRVLSILMLTSSSLRRRFQQNQEDCTFTVLALLPTATENIVEALPVETITHELQQKKAERLGRSGGTPSEISSGPPSVTDEDGKSLESFQSESYVHASQMAASSSGSGDSLPKPPKTKVQLWNDLKISCGEHCFLRVPAQDLLILPSYHQIFHPLIYTLSLDSPHSHPAQPSRPTELSIKRGIVSPPPTAGTNN